MLELDIVIGAWARKNMESLDYNECLQFDSEILQMETPTLTKYIIGELPLPGDKPFLKKLVEFAFSEMKK